MPRRWRRCEDRDYVTLDKRRLIPEDKGRLVTAFLESFFKRYVEYDFTAELEEQLDQISDGELAWKDVLRDFWNEFSGAVDEIKELRVSDVLDALNESGAAHLPAARRRHRPARLPDLRHRPAVAEARQVRRLRRLLELSRMQLHPPARRREANGDAGGGEPATACSATIPTPARSRRCASGRFGPYVQLGDGKEAKRSSLPKGWTPRQHRPREGAGSCWRCRARSACIPKRGKTISAGLGRYGPFVLHDGTYANLDGVEEVFIVGLNRAVVGDRREAAEGPGGRDGGTPAALKELGDHPDGGGKITVRDGKYGPYVNQGKVNATLPKGKDPQAVTLEEALELIAEKAAKGGGKPPARPPQGAGSQEARRQEASRQEGRQPRRAAAKKKA